MPQDAPEPEDVPRSAAASTVQPTTATNHESDSQQSGSQLDLKALIPVFAAPAALTLLAYLLGLFILARKYEALCNCDAYRAWYLTSLTSRTLAIMHAYRNLLLPSFLPFAQTGLVAGGAGLALYWLPRRLPSRAGRQWRDAPQAWGVRRWSAFLAFLIA